MARKRKSSRRSSGSMSLRAAKALLGRKRGRGRPSKEMSAKLKEARAVVARAGGLKKRGRPAKRKTATRKSARKGRKAAKSSARKTRARGRGRPKLPLSQRKLSKTEALKVVAQQAGRRGRKSADFKTALRVLCGARAARKVARYFSR